MRQHGKEAQVYTVGKASCQTIDDQLRKKIDGDQGADVADREGKFIFYELNTSVLEEVMLWMAALKGEGK